MEAGEEEAEAAAAAAALGASEVAAEDLETEAADPAPWGTDRAWTAVEADQRLTAGYEKIRGMGSKNGKAFGKPENAWVSSFCSQLGSLAKPPNQFASPANEMVAITAEFLQMRALWFAVWR